MLPQLTSFPESRSAVSSLLRVKIAITSDCNLRCKYCFIDKDRGEKMSLMTSQEILEQTISSSGTFKSIGIYGGEPLASFPVTAAIIAEANRLAQRYGKSLYLSIATNGLLLRSKHIDYFRRHRLCLCISLDGKTHDRYRVSRDGSGTLSQVLPSLRLALEKLGPTKVIVLHGVLPETSRCLMENVRFYRTLGTCRINLEMIQGIPWTPLAREAFSEQFSRLGEQLVRQAHRGKFLFIESVNRALMNMSGQVQGQKTIEIYPDGSGRLTPYPFAHLLERSSSVLLEDGQDVVRLRDSLSRKIATKLMEASTRSSMVGRYLCLAIRLGLEF